jgi:hypothetical protein
MMTALMVCSRFSAWSNTIESEDSKIPLCGLPPDELNDPNLALSMKNRMKLWMVDPKTADYAGLYQWRSDEEADLYGRYIVGILSPLSRRGLIGYRVLPLQHSMTIWRRRALDRASRRMGAGAYRSRLFRGPGARDQKLLDRVGVPEEDVWPCPSQKNGVTVKVRRS